MEKNTVASAVKLLEEVLEVLDNAYWDASKIAHKDALYDVISMVSEELNELAKLSIEDHYMAYEPISLNFRNSGPRLRRLHEKAPHWIARQKTAVQLNTLLPSLAGLVGH
jgi:hypothetical protein